MLSRVIGSLSLIMLLILIRVLAVAVFTAIGAAARCSSDVFHAIEDDAKDGGFAAIHQTDRVADFLATGGMLTCDENRVVGIVGDECGFVKQADGRGVENDDVEVMLEHGTQAGKRR